MGVNCLIFSGGTDYSFKTIIAGPYRIATQLRQSGFITQVVDVCRYTKFNKIHEAILKKFVDKDTLWIGFSTNFVYHILGFPYRESYAELEYIKKINPKIDFEIKKFMEFCRGLNPNIKFILGGVRLFGLDYLGFVEFRGHTDDQIVDYTEQLAMGIKHDQKIIRNDEYKKFTTSKILYTKNDILDIYKSVSIEVSRGCIFKCKFCSFPLNGKTKGEWIKNTEILKEELIYNYETFGITNYVLTDDTYNDSVEKMTNLYEHVYSKLPFKINFSTYLRADLIYRFPHTAELLVASGLNEANFGLETTNRNAAKIIGKGTDPFLLIDFFQKIKDTTFKNVVTYSSWISGLPGDTKQSLLNFFKWLNSEDNPFHNNRIAPLAIRPKNILDFYMYRSPFDETYDEVCKVDFHMNEQGRWRWKSKETDLTYEWCAKLTEKQGDILSGTRSIIRNMDRIGGRFNNGSLLTLGVDIHDSIHTPAKQALEKYDISKLSYIQEKKYLQNLLSL